MEDMNCEMEMPTPCQHCGDVFDLNDGKCSERWYKNTTICENCWGAERAEIMEDDRWEDANREVADALFIFKNENAGHRLTDENKALITNLINEQ